MVVVVVWVLYTHLKIINYNQLIKIKIIIIINISKRYTIFHKHFSSFDFSYIFLKLIHFNLLFSFFYAFLKSIFSTLFAQSEFWRYRIQYVEYTKINLFWFKLYYSTKDSVLMMNLTKINIYNLFLVFLFFFFFISKIIIFLRLCNLVIKLLGSKKKVI